MLAKKDRTECPPEEFSQREGLSTRVTGPVVITKSGNYRLNMMDFQ